MNSLVFRERLTAIAGIVLLSILAVLSYIYSIEEQLAGLRYVPSENSPDFRAQKITLTDFSNDGTPKHRLAAQTFEHFTDNRIRAEGVRFLTLNPHMAPVRIQADRVWSADALETLEMSGHVVANRKAYANELPLRFSTDYLRGYLDTYTFTTPAPVTMQWGANTTEADGGLRYDHVGHTIDLNGGVRSHFVPSAMKTPK